MAKQLTLKFYEQLLLSFDKLTETERKELLEFERKRPTSEWPGWKKYLGETTRKHA